MGLMDLPPTAGIQLLDIGHSARTGFDTGQGAVGSARPLREETPSGPAAVARRLSRTAYLVTVHTETKGPAMGHE